MATVRKTVFCAFMSLILTLDAVFGVAAFAAEGSDTEYKIGAGDTVRIAIYNNPDLSTEAQVSEDGSISFPLLGKVVIGGLSKSAAEAAISKQLTDGGYLRQAQVNLTVTDYRSQQVAVLGEVTKPGKYPIQSTSTIMDLIAEAGGLTEKGARKITVVRQSANGATEKREVAIDQLMNRNGEIADVALRHGDLIFVPQQPTFYIYGQVQKPGVYPLESNMTVRQAIVVGGGLTLRGTERGVRITRKQEAGKTVSIKAKLNDSLQESDVVEIKESLF